LSTRSYAWLRTLAGSVSGALKASPALRLDDAQIGLSASLYVAGAVSGAVLFGWLTDRYGRRRLFSVTLGLYLLATAATAFSSDFRTFALFRMLTGAGIGGEYAAINSAIQELIPARYRGRTDLIVNGSFWIGAALGAGGAVVLLQPGLFAPDLGWRLAFGIGASLGLVILWLRRFIPESPRWLMTHGRVADAERVMAGIEELCGATRAPDAARIALVHRREVGKLQYIVFTNPPSADNLTAIDSILRSFLASVGLLGALLSLRMRDLLPTAAMVAGWFALNVLIVPDPRYWLDVFPLLAVLAGGVVAALLEAAAPEAETAEAA
jgi:MFS family permease